MITKIRQNVFQINFRKFGGVVYLIKLDTQNILIDTSSAENGRELLGDLKQLGISPEEVDMVVLTHSHWDHVGNKNLFDNSMIITCKNLEELPSELKPILTPGHTRDSFCIFYEDILFSGDTIFHNGGIGRTDLPDGNGREILESVEKLKKIDYDILCPGHIE